MSMPRQKPPGESRQDYETPREFLDAVEARFGRLDVDLACRLDNAKAPRFITEEHNSLAQPWVDTFGVDMNGWLNPPFKRIEPWAMKCRTEGARLQRGRIFMLTPASVASVWFHEHVKDYAVVLALQPRITFVGETHTYPKDLMLSVFGAGLSGLQLWRWK